ncbi:hypothetical protein ZIOFF_010517 [Zingiber officinale]|uniref:Uncharacterized protein n=1 Tax=Zingiber officinale TaxID=94328 RepID=A0A8J5LS52_ZINOF|nr:hypothetical protein ZIOFF_010517 [Zingiber officinale]
MHDIHVIEKGCYDRLRWYYRVIRETNPGSVTECEIDLVLQSYPKPNKKYWPSVFKKAAYAPSLQEHEQYINNIIDSMPLAKGFIVQSHPQSWANAWFLGD